MQEIVCPNCSNKNIGQIKMTLEIEDSTGETIKKAPLFCFNCGSIFAEAEMTNQQKEALKVYQNLNPF